MYQVGDIVLLTFPFTDGIGAKKRPAMVVLDTNDGDILVARVTSKLSNTIYDVTLQDWKAAGLLLPSCVRLHKMATLETKLIEKKLGKLSPADLKIVKEKLESLFT